MGAGGNTAASEGAAICRAASDQATRIQTWNNYVIGQLRERAAEIDAAMRRTGRGMDIYDEIINQADQLLPRH